MIRTWLSLVPSERRGGVIAYTVLALVSVIVRAIATVLLVPLIAALFSETPHRALAWLGWLTAATVTGWVIDTVTAALAKGPFLLGERVSAADILWGTALGWTTGFKLVPERPEIMAYVRRIADRPAVKRAQEKDTALAAAQKA